MKVKNYYSIDVPITAHLCQLAKSYKTQYFLIYKSIE